MHSQKTGVVTVTTFYHGKANLLREIIRDSRDLGKMRSQLSAASGISPHIPRSE